jgi:hypothetical protein
MAPPCPTRHTDCSTFRSKVEQVQPVARTPDLGKQAALLVANEENPILDLDLAPVFIQLPQANDAGA